jgi:hypothetical protein
VGLFDRLFGTEEPEPQRRTADASPRRSDDEIAVERYRYLLRTAPPETIEQVHAEAFAKLTEEQRDLLFAELSSGAPEGEAPRDTSARALASSATRQELRNPGTMERSLGGNAGGVGFGGMVASSLLGTIAGYVIASALVSAFLPDPAGADAGADGGADSGADGSGDAGADGSGDASGGDMGGGDFGGGDFGGGDFGGFDF